MRRTIRFHLDEPVNSTLADGLRRRGIGVTTTTDGLRRRGIGVTTTTDGSLLGADDIDNFSWPRG